jgi:hypothetical protein
MPRGRPTKKLDAGKVKPENLYEQIPKEYILPLETYPNYELMKIKLPFRMLVIGCSGSGKTNLTINLFNMFSCFTHTYLFSKNLKEPLYKLFIDKMSKVSKKLGKELITFSEDIKQLPDVNTFDPKESNLIILDDMILENKKDLAKVEELFIRSRKNNVSMIFISQSYFHIPKMIRRNSDYIIIKKIQSSRDLSRILNEYNLDTDLNSLKKLYIDTSKKMTDFMLLDMETNDPSLKYRHNFASAGI